MSLDFITSHRNGATHLEAIVELEGVSVPFHDFHVTSTQNGMAGMINLHPITSAFNLKANTHIAIFYRYDFQKEFHVLCDGFITNKNAVKPNKRISYSFEGVSKRLNYIPHFYVDPLYAPDAIYNAGSAKKVSGEVSVGHLVLSITNNVSVTKGIQEFVKNIVGSTIPSSILDNITRDYMQQTKLSSRYRVVVEDVNLRAIANAELIKRLFQSYVGQNPSSASIDSVLKYLMSLMYYGMYEQFSPSVVAGNIDMIPKLYFTTPPKCNMLMPSQFSVVENMMRRPTRTGLMVTVGTASKVLMNADMNQLPNAFAPQPMIEKYRKIPMVMPGTEEEYKGAIWSMHSKVDIPLIAYTSLLKENIYEKTTEYMHHMQIINSTSLPGFQLPMFDPMVLLGVPACVVDPTGDHYIGTPEAITHTFNVEGSSSTNVGMSHCYPLNSISSHRPHPWIDPKATNVAGLTEMYEVMYGTTMMIDSAPQTKIDAKPGEETNEFNQYKSDMNNMIGEYLRAGASDIEIYRDKARVGVMTMSEYRKTVNIKNDGRKLFVLRYLEEFKKIQLTGAVHYGYEPDKQNRLVLKV